ncbi:hypothetical protein C7212DRAFT_280540 [Tuber magnatum]|uniref:Uncharacterized protein n=1 Tax=Tuber magnatum TaxID=42249 RepID=A0A317SPI1_9PEZI|nr:hypothetical protein C7212DRAFT_280540 [Tuber magnatum]
MPSKDEDAEFAKAYKDLVEAEKHAATLENQLSSLEHKLDSFLAEHEGKHPESNNTNASGSISSALGTRVNAPQGGDLEKTRKDPQ